MRSTDLDGGGEWWIWMVGGGWVGWVGKRKAGVVVRVAGGGSC